MYLREPVREDGVARATRGGLERNHAPPSRMRAKAGHRLPLNPIMPCTTDSLACAISACSRIRSAQSSQTFLPLPATLTVTRASTSSPHSLHAAITFLRVL